MVESAEPLVYVKIHNRGPDVVVGACDCDIIGCCFKDGKRKLDVREAFYKGEVLPVSEAVILLSKAVNLNVVGKTIVNALLDAQVINSHNVVEIGETLFAMKIVL